jgi:hypothetical protein
MRNPRIKYVLCPGMVRSQTDGQRHWIGAFPLAQLYGVTLSECAIYEPVPWWPSSFYAEAEKRHKGLIHLEPREDGDYKIPTTIDAARSKT